MRIVLMVYCLTFSVVWIGGCQDKGLSATSNEPEAVTSTTGKKSVGQELAKHNHLPIEDRIAIYYRLKIESPNGYMFDNLDDITMYGYHLLWDDKVMEAMEIFKLIVSEHPDYANGYDSLGEAYLKSGDRKRALENYEKSLAMDPYNYNAAEQIKRINDPDYVTPVSTFDQIFTIEQYREDLDELGKTLLEVNPNTLKFISKEDFLKTIEEKKALITDATTYGNFLWHCSEIIANANCSHTSMGGFFKEWELLPYHLRFPLQVRWIENHLYVVANDGNEDKVSVKDELLTINGIAVSELIQEIYQHIPSQGHIQTSKRYDFEGWAPGMIPYALGFPEKFELTIAGKNDPIVLNGAEKDLTYYSKPIRHRNPRQKLQFEILDDTKTAILTIASFNYYWWNNLDFFEGFIDHSFTEMEEAGVENLIIDVRYNGGGSQDASIHLLKHLMKEPFVYYVSTPNDMDEGMQYPYQNTYSGKLYFLFDGEGNSTTGHFMAVAKAHNLGVIIGEELGSNQFCTAGQITRRLSNTRMEYYIANATCISAAPALPDERGILPDYSVEQSIDDFLNEVDAVKEYAIELIE